MAQVGNALERVPRWLNRFERLRRLILSSNRIAKIDDRAFAPHAALEEVDLTANALRRMPKSLFHLRRLRVLRASHNRLREVPAAVEHLAPSLERLELSGNLLRELPEELCRLEHLGWLYLSQNRLERLPEGMGRLGELRLLHASHNALSWLPVSMRDMLVLQVRLRLLRRRVGRGRYAHHVARAGAAHGWEPIRGRADAAGAHERASQVAVAAGEPNRGGAPGTVCRASRSLTRGLGRRSRAPSCTCRS